MSKISTALTLVIAAVAHEINRAYCAALGDDSQPEWDDAPDWQKDSAVGGVEFHLANPDAGPEASHESWLAQKEADGWTYGEEKDPEAKTHPCFVPFTELPPEQQAKDFLFRQTVHSLAERLPKAESATLRGKTLVAKLDKLIDKLPEGQCKTAIRRRSASLAWKGSEHETRTRTTLHLSRQGFPATHRSSHGSLGEDGAHPARGAGLTRERPRARAGGVTPRDLQG